MATKELLGNYVQWTKMIRSHTVVCLQIILGRKKNGYSEQKNGLNFTVHHQS